MPPIYSGVARTGLQDVYWVNHLFGSSQYDKYGTNADLCSDETIVGSSVGADIHASAASGALHHLSRHWLAIRWSWRRSSHVSSHILHSIHTQIDLYPEGTQATNDGVDSSSPSRVSWLLQKGMFIARIIIVF